MLAFFLGVLGIGRSVITAVITWLSRRSLAELASLALVIVCLVLFLSLSAEKRHSAKLQTQLTSANAALAKERQGRAADRASYTKAQADAHTANVADVTKKEAQSKRISDDERQAYLSDLAKLRADNKRLRSQDGTTEGAAGAAGSSEDQSASPRIDENGLCVPASSDVCEAGAEIELRLLHLQNYNEKQLSNDPNK